MSIGKLIHYFHSSHQTCHFILSQSKTSFVQISGPENKCKNKSHPSFKSNPSGPSHLDVHTHTSFPHPSFLSFYLNMTKAKGIDERMPVSPLKLIQEQSEIKSGICGRVSQWLNWGPCNRMQGDRWAWWRVGTVRRWAHRFAWVWRGAFLCPENHFCVVDA